MGVDYNMIFFIIYMTPESSGNDKEFINAELGVYVVENMLALQFAFSSSSFCAMGGNVVFAFLGNFIYMYALAEQPRAFL